MRLLTLALTFMNSVSCDLLSKGSLGNIGTNICDGVAASHSYYWQPHETYSRYDQSDHGNTVLVPHTP